MNSRPQKGKEPENDEEEGDWVVQYVEDSDIRCERLAGGNMFRCGSARI
jgi:hypothetical protein